MLVNNVLSICFERIMIVPIKDTFQCAFNLVAQNRLSNTFKQMFDWTLLIYIKIRKSFCQVVVMKFGAELFMQPNACNILN